MAGLAGFGPANDGVRAHCLTTWRQPNWGGQPGLNRRPPESQSGALPTELCPPLARRKGFEPLTYCLEGSCSILLSYRRKSRIKPPLQSITQFFKSQYFLQLNLYFNVQQKCFLTLISCC